MVIKFMYIFCKLMLLCSCIYIIQRGRYMYKSPLLTGMLTFKWVKLSISFNFVFMIRDDPSRSELIRPGLAVRVGPVRLLYLPLFKVHATTPCIYSTSHIVAIYKSLLNMLCIQMYIQ